MNPVCPACGGREWDVNVASGDTICVSCGYVGEQNAIVSSVEFQETAGGARQVGA